MLKHDERYSLLDALRPPSGYRLDAAIGTAFSMDFVTLTAVMLAFMDAEKQDEESKAYEIQPLHALTCLSSRVRVFINRGYITVRKTSKIFALYDRIVREIEFEQGSFHPKLWVLKFRPKKIPEMVQANPIFRLICMSRNLTTAPNWELAVCLEGIESRRSNDFGNQATRFFKHVIEASADPEDSSTGVIGNLLRGLPRVEFKFPQGIKDSFNLRWQWNNGPPLAKLIPLRGKRALVVSPFIGESFVRSLVKTFDRLIVVATRSSLDGLEDDLFAELAEHDLYAVVSDLSEDGLPALDLHAKLYIFEEGGESHVFMGSANATYSAWHGVNCEAILAFKNGITIDKFISSFVEKDKDTLHGWITEYTEEDRKSIEEESDEERAEKLLDHIHEKLSHLKIMASYDKDSQALTLKALNYDFLGQLPAEMVEDLTIGLAPLTLCDRSNDGQGNSFLPIYQAIQAPGLKFENVPVSSLTEFICIEITHKKLKSHVKRFVIKADVDYIALAKDRDRGLINEIINSDNIQYFLRFILFDGARRTIDYPTDSPPPPLPPKKLSTGILGDVTVEDVLKSCTEDPSRVSAINNLVQRRHRLHKSRFSIFLEGVH